MARFRRDASSSSGTAILYAVVGAIVVILFAAAAYMTSTSPTVPSSATRWTTPMRWMPQWGMFGGRSGAMTTTPPLQDNLDRILPDPVTEIMNAPNNLARLRAESAWGGGGGGGALFGGGMGGGGGGLGGMGRVWSTVIPTSVRPPIDRTYKQVGTIARRRADGGDVDNADLDILPLMGQWLRDDKWRYFTVTGGGVRLPVERADAGSGKRRCTSEYGCGELFSDDAIAVSGFKDKFVANVYENGTFYS